MSRDSENEQKLKDLVDKSFSEYQQPGLTKPPHVSANESLENLLGQHNRMSNTQTFVKNKPHHVKPDNLDDVVEKIIEAEMDLHAPFSAAQATVETNALDTVISAQNQSQAKTGQHRQAMPLNAEPEPLDNLVELTHDKKPSSGDAGIRLEKTFFTKTNKHFLLRYFLIALLTGAVTLSLLHYLSKELSTVVEKNLSPAQILQRMDNEIQIYQRENNHLPAELTVLISFPEDAVEWPFMYRSIQNIEGKAEILFNPSDSGNYSLYYRLDDLILMKVRGQTVKQIKQIP